MRVLVTGTSGHVGGAIARHLIKCGINVIGLSRRLADINGLTRQIQADIGATDFMRTVVCQTEKCSAIVHAAACLNKDFYTPEVSLVNCFGTHQLLALADHWKVENFVYISGVNVIGKPQIHPITEDHPVEPSTDYLASKLYGERLVQIANSCGISGAILRLSSPVGTNMPGMRVFSVFVRNALSNKAIQILGRGTRKQNYVDARDVAKAVETCLQQKVKGLFNIAGSKVISNYELAQLSIRLLNSSAVIEFANKIDIEEGNIWDIAIAKAKSKINYKPRYSIEDSIHAVAEDYMHNAK